MVTFSEQIPFMIVYLMQIPPRIKRIVCIASEVWHVSLPGVILIIQWCTILIRSSFLFYYLLSAVHTKYLDADVCTLIDVLSAYWIKL